MSYKPFQPFPHLTGTDIIWYVDPQLMCPFCAYGVMTSLESKMCFECFKEITNRREIADDEIVFDIDNREEHGTRCFMQTGINLVEAGYHIEIWFADGMKQPHIHVKNIQGLNKLPKDVLRKYKQLLIEKYIPKEFWNEKIPDKSLYSSHLIASENRPHAKYGTIKLLTSEFNIGNQNKIERDIYEQCNQTNPLISSKKSLPEGETQYKFQKIASKLSCSDLADMFGLEPMGKNKRICPFHADSDPSLSLDYYLGMFRCFGCNVKGKITEFYARLKELNPKFKLGVST